VPSRIPNTLKPVFTARFVKFCTVGFSGVFVNLGFLLLFADILDIQINIASALAIEISILSNFVINELWTFRDRRGNGTIMARGAQFNLVSLLGAFVQWSVFVTLNVFAFLLLASSEVVDQYWSQAGDGFWPRFIHPIVEPPPVGNFKYLSQLVGIGVATFWNFLVNFNWTWSGRSAGGEND